MTFHDTKKNNGYHSLFIKLFCMLKCVYDFVTKLYGQSSDLVLRQLIADDGRSLMVRLVNQDGQNGAINKLDQESLSHILCREAVRSHTCVS